jgi:hypothetical protein
MTYLWEILSLWERVGVEGRLVLASQPSPIRRKEKGTRVREVIRNQNLTGYFAQLFLNCLLCFPMRSLRFLR